MNPALPGCIHPKAHLIALDAKHGHGDFTLAHDQAFGAPTGQSPQALTSHKAFTNRR